MLLHADTIAQNRATGVWARRIDRDDAHSPILFAIVAGKLIDQCAFSGARRTGQSEYPRMPAVWEERLEQFRPAWRPVLDCADGTRQNAGIAGAELIN